MSSSVDLDYFENEILRLKIDLQGSVSAKKSKFDSLLKDDEITVKEFK